MLEYTPGVNMSVRRSTSVWAMDSSGNEACGGLVQWQTPQEETSQTTELKKVSTTISKQLGPYGARTCLLTITLQASSVLSKAQQETVAECGPL